MIKRTVFVAIVTPYGDDMQLDHARQSIYGVFEEYGAAERHWNVHGNPGSTSLRVSEETVLDWAPTQVR